MVSNYFDQIPGFLGLSLSLVDRLRSLSVVGSGFNPLGRTK